MSLWDSHQLKEDWRLFGDVCSAETGVQFHVVGRYVSVMFHAFSSRSGADLSTLCAPRLTGNHLFTLLFYVTFSVHFCCVVVVG